MGAFSVNPGSELYIIESRDSDLRFADIKLITQSYMSPEMVSSWLQKKKQGMPVLPFRGLCHKLTLEVESEDLPLILQQAPKSVEQASATVLRALLDPVIKGLARHVPVVDLANA